MRCFINGNGERRTVNSQRRTKRGSYKKRSFRALSLLFTVLRSPFLYACPLCKEALSTGLAKGFFWSILLMLGVPMLVVGVISTVVWRAYRKGSTGVADG